MHAPPPRGPAPRWRPVQTTLPGLVPAWQGREREGDVARATRPGSCSPGREGFQALRSNSLAEAHCNCCWYCMPPPCYTAPAAAAARALALPPAPHPPAHCCSRPPVAACKHRQRKQDSPAGCSPPASPPQTAAAGVNTPSAAPTAYATTPPRLPHLAQGVGKGARVA